MESDGGAVHACDVTNASRTQLFNLQTLAWDAAPLAIFEIPRVALPEVKLSSALYGETVALPGFRPGAPIALRRLAIPMPLLTVTPASNPALSKPPTAPASWMTPTTTRIFSEKGLSSSIAWGYRKAKYCLEGNIYVTGAAVHWLSDLLGLGVPEKWKPWPRKLRTTAGSISSQRWLAGRAVLAGFSARV